MWCNSNSMGYKNDRSIIIKFKNNIKMLIAREV